MPAEAVLESDGEPLLSEPARARSALGAPALDLHEGIVTPCRRVNAGIALLSSLGEVVQPRCRATNLCRYCQRLYVLETLEMLQLDAVENAPTIYTVLTAREHLTRAQCKGHLDHVRRSVRKRWPDAEWFVQVEFQRRGALHLNLLHKGVPVDDLDELHELLAERWCERVDAKPVAQWSGAIEDARGVIGYLQKTLAHGLKAEQTPPIGWRGHRTSQTRGYLVRPASAMRVEAKRSLQVKRELWRAADGERSADEVELVAERAIEQADATSWRLVDVTPAPDAIDVKAVREAAPGARRERDDLDALIGEQDAEWAVAHELVLEARAAA